MRNDLTVLEQGEHLLRRKELIGRRAGENQFTVLGGETVSPPKTTEEIAEAIGLTERSSQRRMQAAREITEDNIAAVNLYGAFTQTSTTLRLLLDSIRDLPADASEDDIKKAASQSFAEAGDVWE